MKKLILASSSPRRRDLLRKINSEFKIIPSPYVEDHTKTDFSYEFVESLAVNKALAVVPLAEEPSIVVGADTVVVLDDEILGKPKDEAEAYDMLKRLSGRTHSVVTGTAVIDSETHKLFHASSTSRVTFETLSDEQIKFYIENYKPLDKAGSYGIQEMPDGYIREYTGSLDNIIGLDVELLKRLLSEV